MISRLNQPVDDGPWHIALICLFNKKRDPKVMNALLNFEHMEQLEKTFDTYWLKERKLESPRTPRHYHLKDYSRALKYFEEKFRNKKLIINKGHDSITKGENQYLHISDEFLYKSEGLLNDQDCLAEKSKDPIMSYIPVRRDTNHSVSSSRVSGKAVTIVQRKLKPRRKSDCSKYCGGLSKKEKRIQHMMIEYINPEPPVISLPTCSLKDTKKNSMRKRRTVSKIFATVDAQSLKGTRMSSFSPSNSQTDTDSNSPMSPSRAMTRKESIEQFLPKNYSSYRKGTFADTTTNILEQILESNQLESSPRKDRKKSSGIYPNITDQVILKPFRNSTSIDALDNMSPIKVDHIDTPVKEPIETYFPSSSKPRKREISLPKFSHRKPVIIPNISTDNIHSAHKSDLKSPKTTFSTPKHLRTSSMGSISTHADPHSMFNKPETQHSSALATPKTSLPFIKEKKKKKKFSHERNLSNTTTKILQNNRKLILDVYQSPRSSVLVLPTKSKTLIDNHFQRKSLTTHDQKRSSVEISSKNPSLHDTMLHSPKVSIHSRPLTTTKAIRSPSSISLKKLIMQTPTRKSQSKEPLRTVTAELEDVEKILERYSKI